MYLCADMQIRHILLTKNGSNCSPWLLPLLLPLIVWGLYGLLLVVMPECLDYRLIYTPLDSLIKIRPALYPALALGFVLLLLIPFPSIAKKKEPSPLFSKKTHSYLEDGALLSWTLGYGNILFGVIPSVIGLLIPFIVGSLFHIIYALKMGKKPSIQPRGYIFFILLYLCYDLLTILWARNFTVALDWWWREASLLPPLLLLAIYPPSESTIHRLMHYALRIVYLYILANIAVYATVCLLSGNSLGVALCFEKCYFSFNHEATSPAFLAMVFGLQHYTYLGILMLIPLLYILLVERGNRAHIPLAVVAFLGFISYLFIFQSRILILIILALLLLIALERMTHWSYPKLLLGGALLGIVGRVLLLLTRPSSLSYLIDDHRLNLLTTASRYLGDHLWEGYGLGSAKSLIFPFYQGMYATHFHNQYVLCLLEGGIPSLILWVGIWGSYLYHALKRSNYPALLMGVVMAILFTVDLITCLSQYLISMGMMLLFLLLSHPHNYGISRDFPKAKGTR